MQRVAVIVPFANLAVEEEFQRYVNNPNLIYQLFKLDYTTHKHDGEEKFYEELKKSLQLLTEKLSTMEFNKIINMCSSLNVQIKNNIFDSNLILKDYLVKKKAKISIFISPYSKEITSKITDFLEINPIIEYVNFMYSKDYYNFGKETLMNVLHKQSGTVLISCTNIPTLDLINKYKNNLLSTNQAIIEYINRIS